MTTCFAFIETIYLIEFFNIVSYFTCQSYGGQASQKSCELHSGTILTQKLMKPMKLDSIEGQVSYTF